MTRRNKWHLKFRLKIEIIKKKAAPSPHVYALYIFPSSVARVTFIEYMTYTEKVNRMIIYCRHADKIISLYSSASVLK